MSNRQKRPEARCPVCQMRQELCICEETQACRQDLRGLQTRLVLIMHYRERPKTTNTGRLAHLALPGSEIRERGRDTLPFSSDGLLDPERQTLLLYPSEEAQVLSDDWVAHRQSQNSARPFTLLVPDGNWRQASKVAKREAFLRGVTHVTLPPDAPTEYGLRREVKDGGLATFEAITRALGFLEGPERGPKTRARLEQLFRLMVRRTLRSRAGILTQENNGTD